MVISTVVWNSLSADQQELLQAAAREAEEEQKVSWKKASAEALEKVQEAGVTIYRPDRNAFAEKVRPLYEQFKSDPAMDALIREIRSVQ
jgi:TRAP-type C4-dicarboxylate transport system substrate-binding protein